jgi:hypothetical protein
MKSKFTKFVFGTILFFSVGLSGQAASLQINNTNYVVQQNGSALANPAAGSGYGVALGYFDAGFTATQLNVGSWLDNFRGYRGFWDNSPTIQASIILKFNQGVYHDADNGTFDWIPVGANSSGAIGITDGVTTFNVGTALNVILWGGVYNTSTPSLANGVALLANSGWTVPNAYNTESPDPLINNLVLNSSTTALVGSIDNSTTGPTARTITLVPEPSTGALMMIGAAGLVALRRLRKV